MGPRFVSAVEFLAPGVPIERRHRQQVVRATQLK